MLRVFIPATKYSPYTNSMYFAFEANEYKDFALEPNFAERKRA